jgi:hypothetical protein
VIPQGLLGNLRAGIANYIGSDSVDIYRWIPDNDGLGGVVAVWRKLSTIKATLRAGADTEVVTADAMQPEGAWVLTCPYGTDIEVEDRVYRPGQTPYAGSEYWEVEGEDQGHSDAVTLTINLRHHVNG